MLAVMPTVVPTVMRQPSEFDSTNASEPRILTLLRLDIPSDPHRYEHLPMNIPRPCHLLLLAMALIPALAMVPIRAAEPGEVPASVPELPPGGDILNVRDAAYGAVGDGVADDTAAIQKALSEALDSHRVVYLPKGIYLVSDSLRWWRAGYNIDQVNGWGGFMQLQGQSRSGTIIRLKDNAAGFTNAGQTKAVIITASRGYHGNKGYRSGEGNEAFENHLRDFTLDVGKGNAGAVGIDY